MNFKDYQKAASRTLQCDMTPEQLISNLGLGIAGECAELAYLVNYHQMIGDTWTNYAESLADECSDLVWYIFMIAEFYNYRLYDRAILARDRYYNNLAQANIEQTPMFVTLELCYACGSITDYIKKITYHDHRLEYSKMASKLVNALGAWIGFVDFYELVMPEILQHNIDKLWKRYPNGFNYDDSRKRQDVSNESI